MQGIYSITIVNFLNLSTKQDIIKTTKKLSLHIKKSIIFKPGKISKIFSDSFATDTARQLHIFRHNRDALGVDRAQVCVFKKTDQVGLASLLKHVRNVLIELYK